MGAACAGEPANGHKLSNGHKLAKGRGLRWRACEGVDEVDELRNALEELRENVITWDTSAQQVKDAFGVSPWAAVEMPAWFHHKPNKRHVFEPMKIRIDYDRDMTYMRKPRCAGRGQKELPPCMEIGANSALWDPLGFRWGRGAHWPLLASIGTGRYRSDLMKYKRAQKQKYKRNIAKG